MNKFAKRLLIAALFIALIIALRFANITKYINIAFFHRYNTLITQFIQHNYLASVIIFILSMIVLIIFFIPLTPLLNIAAGYFFGFFLGVIYVLIGSTAGATASFLIFRYLLNEMVYHRFGHRLKDFNREIKQHGAKYLLSLQLLPITPFSVVIVLASLSPISTFTFIWTTFIGILPGVLIYVYAGKEFMELESLSDIWSWHFIAALLLLTFLAVLPLLVRLLGRRKGN